jgi:hypothetical protein
MKLKLETNAGPNCDASKYWLPRGDIVKFAEGYVAPDGRRVFATT